MKKTKQKLWTTSVNAITILENGKTAVERFDGPHVPGETKAEAIKYTRENNLGYCIVENELVEEITNLSQADVRDLTGEA